MNPNIESVRQLLASEANPLIVVGMNPSIDQMGAALAFYLALLDFGKNPSIVALSQPLVEVSSLVGIDRVKTSYEGGASSDLTVSFPYREGEIDKVSYTLDNGLLNIIVKATAAGLSFNERDVVYKRAGSAPKVLFAIAVSKMSDLTSMFDTDSLKDTKIVNIDNTVDNQKYGDILLVNGEASSLSEVMANLILSLDLPLNVDSSQNLLSGISVATNNFASLSTSPLAFEMASVMMRNGAKRMQNSQENLRRGNIQREVQKENKGQIPPGDWLEPKIFKGSSNI